MMIETYADFARYSVRAAGSQTQGTRKEQEDSFILLPSAGRAHPVGHFLALVADGMGGMGGGRAAGETAAKTFGDAWLSPDGTTLHAALDAANDALAKGKQSGRILPLAGTTLAALEITEEGCQWLHVGDSYLFLFQNGKLSRVNTALNMQWWREEKKKNGLELTAEEKETDGQILFSALCGDEIRAAESAEGADCTPGCRYLVASDGIAPIFENGTLQALLAQPDIATAPPATVAEHILRAEQALKLEQQDNASVIVVDILPPQKKEHTNNSEIIAPAMITYSKVSELGDRNTQQDNEGCWVSPDAALAVVADGAGGYNNSEMASYQVVNTLKECWETALCYGVDALAAGRILAEAALKAHRRVLEQSGGDANRCGKSAFVALYLHKGKYAVVHVGDCRAYLGNGKKWVPLTKDDSMLQRLLDSGKITPQQAKNSPEQSVLLQAIGATQEPTPHVAIGSYYSTQSFLLCCDGFWNQLPDNMWQKFAWTPPTMDRQHVLETLAQSAVANAGGDSDNVSAIWLHPQVYVSPTAATARMTIISAAILALLTGIVAMCWLTLKPTDTVGTPDTTDTTIATTNGNSDTAGCKGTPAVPEITNTPATTDTTGTPATADTTTDTTDGTTDAPATTDTTDTPATADTTDTPATADTTDTPATTDTTDAPSPADIKDAPATADTNGDHKGELSGHNSGTVKQPDKGNDTDTFSNTIPQGTNTRGR